MALWLGAFNCGCCEPPPPPPPLPGSSYGYYNSGGGCQCRYCYSGIPCAWQIEVSGFVNGPASGGCASGTLCTGNNGTFILDRYTGAGISDTVCYFESPSFASTIYYSFFPPPSPPTCVDNTQYWNLYFYPDGAGNIRISLNLGMVGFGNSANYSKLVPIEYPADGSYPYDRINCKKTFTLDLQESYGVPIGTPCCCHGAPATIDIVPL